MTKTDRDPAASHEPVTKSGEQMLNTRRGKFWRLVVFGMVVATATGLALGIASAAITLGDIPSWVIVPLLILTAAGFVWFTLKYYRSIDEVDLLDNLWANTFGLYAIIIGAGGWLILAEIDIMPPVDIVALVTGTLFMTFAAYFIRRAGFR